MTRTWYTDGLVERRGRPLDDGFDALALATSRWAGPGMDMTQMCTALADELIDEPAVDDVVVVCVDLTASRSPTTLDRRPAPVLRWTLQDAGDLTRTRRAARRWATHHRLSNDSTQALVLAINEALSNALEHSAPAGGKQTLVELTAIHVDDSVIITVQDNGAWQSSVRAHSGRGRGLGLIRTVSSSVGLLLTDTGTRVRHRAACGYPRSMSSTGPEPMAEVSIHHGAQHVTVTVTGEIDMSNARDIDQVIAAALTDPPAGPSTPPIDHEPPQEDRSRYLVFEPQCRHLPRQCGIAHDR